MIPRSDHSAALKQNNLITFFLHFESAETSMWDTDRVIDEGLANILGAA